MVDIGAMECNLEQTRNLARELAREAKTGDCFCLTGDLGAGKTEFARSFIRELCGSDVTVGSPTFNIVQLYGENLYHFDLYRLKDDSELEEIGFREALDKGICLIEWPQVAAQQLPDKKVDIHIEIGDENRRKITICKN